MITAEVDRKLVALTGNPKTIQVKRGRMVCIYKRTWDNYHAMGNVPHTTRFFDKKVARPSLRSVEEYEERFHFAQYRIHRSQGNRQPVC